jgi:hypothetical protein
MPRAVANVKQSAATHWNRPCQRKQSACKTAMGELDLIRDVGSASAAMANSDALEP